MKNVWFITNPSSGSTSATKCDAIEAVLAERGLSLVGRTAFPADALPDPAALDAAGVDTAVLFAGDGTVNAAVCALAEWGGAILILPGGTMNLLAKTLHGNADAAAIIHAAHLGGATVTLPFVEAGSHRGLVGVILGPAASWVRARELVRAGRVRGLLRAMRHAWAKTFTRGIRLEGVRGLRHRQQAIFVMPDDGKLDLRGVDARAWRSIVSLGWDWLTGDWVASPAVTQVHVASFRVAGRKPTLALFDGEPVMLDPAVTITGGTTAKMFIRTKEDAA
ncbi:diacylglycerol/lipid kinase family protein [Sphingomonas sp. PB4P5]|uniref:diacylglycerol/lipid kinase family protein n=1 Tax=Parasphingomonas puruogangriensis TaxID=3096155 RepID=UPI002FCCA9A6